MNYREFAEYIRDNISGHLKDFGKIKVRLIDGGSSDNIILAVSTSTAGFFHIITVSDYYPELQNGRDIDGIMEDIAEVTGKNLLLMGNVKRRDVEEWEKVRKKIVPKLIIPGDRFFRPDVMPHRSVADLMAVYLIALKSKTGINYAPVTFSMLERYSEDHDLTMEGLNEAAMVNLRKAEISFGHVKDVLGIPFWEQCKEKGFSDVYLVSAPVSLAAPEVMIDNEKLAAYSDVIGGDYLIFPVSMAYMFLAPVSDSPEGSGIEELKKLFLGKLPTEAEPFLSDKVYIYDSISGMVRL